MTLRCSRCNPNFPGALVHKKVHCPCYNQIYSVIMLSKDFLIRCLFGGGITAGALWMMSRKEGKESKEDDGDMDSEDDGSAGLKNGPKDDLADDGCCIDDDGVVKGIAEIVEEKEILEDDQVNQKDDDVSPWKPNGDDLMKMLMEAPQQEQHPELTEEHFQVKEALRYDSWLLRKNDGESDINRQNRYTYLSKRNSEEAESWCDNTSVILNAYSNWNSVQAVHELDASSPSKEITREEELDYSAISNTCLDWGSCVKKLDTTKEKEVGTPMPNLATCKRALCGFSSRLQLGKAPG